MSNIKNLAIHQKTELPSNIEAEQTLIGSILENNEMFDEISEMSFSFSILFSDRVDVSKSVRFISAIGFDFF